MEIFARNSLSDFQGLNKIFGYDIESLRYGNLFYTRLHRILSYSLQNKCSVLYDAEQSYIQRILDSTALYFSSILNKDFPTILETVQCYLKDSPHKIDYFINFYRKNNLKLGFKVVRGAYLVEETKLSSENHSERLIWDTIEETHSNYNDIMRKLVSCYKEGDKVNKHIR
jgi:proline dehydrogenase